MKNFSEIIPLILEDKMVQAKELLEQRLYSKMGVILESKLEEYAPTIFMTEEEKALYEEEKKKKPDDDKDGVPDWADKKPGKDDNPEDNTTPPEDEEEKDMKEDLDLIIAELAQIVEEIEQELGEELTDDEVTMIAEELLSEKKSEDSEDDEEEEDEEDSEDDEKSMCEECDK